jgi:hypothetical protein
MLVLILLVPAGLVNSLLLFPYNSMLNTMLFYY